MSLVIIYESMLAFLMKSVYSTLQKCQNLSPRLIFRFQVFVLLKCEMSEWFRFLLTFSMGYRDLTVSNIEDFCDIPLYFFN